LRKMLIPTAGLVVLGAAAVAVGPVVAQDTGSQTVLTAKPVVTPSKAGTKSHPQGVKLNVKVHWETPADLDKPVTQSADVLFPKGSLYNGAKYPSCTQNVLARQGPKGCNKKAIMGAGTATAYADTVLTHPVITVVNGGGSKVFLYTVLNNPARVQAPVPGTITKATGQWAYKLHLVVPTSLQIVAGIPIALRDFNVTAGGKSWAKDWLATTSCPASKKWPFSVQTFFNTGGSSTYQSTVACS
jgi:hypothetical protein